jgi:hypothetical protein
MRAITFWTVVTATVILFTASNLMGAEALQINNDGNPEFGTKTIELEPLWTIGGAEDDVLFGTIERVLVLDDGRILLLDSQLSHVLECSPDGKVIRVLGHSGEGPGELTNPRDLVSFADGTLGLVKMFPGQLVMLKPDGNPAGVIKLETDDAPGGFATLHRSLQAGGTLLLGGSIMTMNPDQPAWFTPEGTLLQSATLPVKPWPRNQRAYDRMYSILKRQADHMPGTEPVPAATEPVVVDLMLRDNGDVWCLTSRSMWEAEDGTFASYDVFNEKGIYTQQVRIVCEGDATRDRLLISGDRAYRVAGYWDAVNRVQGTATEKDIEPMSVTCYRIR